MTLSLGIARKLYLSLAVLIVGMGLIGFAYWRVHVGIATGDARLEQFQAQDAQVRRLQSAFADARRLQAEYAQSFSANAGNRFREALDELHGALLVLPKAPGNQYAPLHGVMDEYLQAGAAMDARIGELGRTADLGLQGELRHAVHGVENLLDKVDAPRLQISMLTLRRHEKDFILRREQKYVDHLGEEVATFSRLLPGAQIATAQRSQLRDLLAQYQQHFDTYAAARFAMDRQAAGLEDIATRTHPVLTDLRVAQDAALREGRAQQAAERKRLDLIFGVTLLAVAGVTILMLVLSLRAIVRPLQRAIAFARNIADGRLDTSLAIDNPRDEIGLLGRTLLQMQTGLRERIERDRTTAQENMRVRQALDAAQAAVMVTDAQARVVYGNEALRQAFADAAVAMPETGAVLAELAPQVDALAQRSTAEQVSTHAELQLGSSRFRVQVSPVLSEGTLIGLALEWQDLRLERIIQDEVSAVVARAAQGHLDQRIVTEGKQGFVAVLAENINRLLGSVQARLFEVSRVMEAFANGDLRERMRGEHQGIYAQLRDSLNTAIAQVDGIVTGIQDSAHGVRASAEEMASGTSDLSARTERQASDLQEAMGLMNGVSADVDENIGLAQASTVMAAAASDAARNGRGVARSAVDGMAQLRGSSRRIGEIVTTVDSLAFQTNLLALNAAVEAARAGSQGRGFAVVAGEVRNLAQRSATAAQEIRGLIETSLAQMEAGARLVESTGNTMEEILEKTERVAEVIAHIHEGSDRQGQAIRGIDQRLQRMNQDTEQNAALAEESSAAARQMLEQADALTLAAATFVTDAGVVQQEHAELEQAELEGA